MSKNINYYPGLTLSKEEIQYKDYSDKYLSLFVDLIRSGTEDVIFFKNTDSFKMEKISNSPTDFLRINEGFCLLMDINESIADFDFSETLNINEFPDQRFFVKSEQYDITVPSLSEGEERYIYLKSRIVPAGFKCTVESGGTVTINDDGTIRKSEVGSVIRGSNSGAPTRVRFVKTDYTAAENGNNIFEVNSFDDDYVILNGNVAAESGEVICIPIGSFDLGVENNLVNRALFGFTEITPFLDVANDLNDGANGIIKLGKIVYQTSTEYDIVDKRNNNKYIIEIDTDIDLSDFVTKSTNQVITGEKYFRALVQGRLATTNTINNGLIRIDVSNAANEFIVDCGNTSSLNIRGFYSESKSFGSNPLNNIVPGTTIRCRFINIGNGTVFNFGNFNGMSSNLLVRAGVLYTLRYEELSVAFGENAPRFSLSPTATHQDISDLDEDIVNLDGDILDLDGRITQNEGDISTNDTNIGTKKDKNDFSVAVPVNTGEDIKVNRTSIDMPYGGNTIRMVFITAEIPANTTETTISPSLIAGYRPTAEVINKYETNSLTGNYVSLTVTVNGNVIVYNQASYSQQITVSYLTQING